MLLKKIIGAVWFCLLLHPAQAETLRFAVPEYAPFTTSIHGKASGFGVEKVEKILKDAGFSMEAHVVPNYSRCLLEVKNNAVEGFFLGSQNKERDALATMTLPVMTNNWIWVSKKTHPLKPDAVNFKKQGRIGVILNTNPHSWLKAEQYNIIGTPSNVANLIEMLDLGRIDSALIPELVFMESIRNQSKRLDEYRMVVQSRNPFGIYLSKQYLAKNPDVLGRINAVIKRQTPMAQSYQPQINQRSKALESKR